MGDVGGLRSAGMGAVFLPPVVHEASAAVLVVDLRRGEVTFVNDLAGQLAPGVELPIAVDEWSAVAGLEDVAGDDLPEGDDEPRGAERQPARPLIRIAEGRPVTGEAVTAERATSATGAREVLWVVGLPLTGAPDPVAHLALVVFLPARNAELIAGAQESAVSLRDRAVLATRVSFTITDPNAPDDPIVWVNPAFTATTGYSAQDSVGRNCRFLQGEGTDRRVVGEIAASLAAEQPVTATLLNYRKDGTPFWNELSISPIRDHAGTLTHFVGVQADVTARVEAQRTRDDALSQVAQVADRLALLADFSSRMAMSLQPRQIVQMLADVLVPRVGTWCIVYVLDEAGRLMTPVVRHERADGDPSVIADIEALRAVVPEQLTPDSPVLRVLDGRDDVVLIDDYDAASPSVSGTADDERTALNHRLGIRSLAAVPLLARHGIIGCVALIADDSRPLLDQSDVVLLRDLAARAGLVLENTQLYSRQRAAAATLQRSLLPRLPRIEGIEVAARYVPSADEAAVGGDWYDVFPVRGGGVCAVVGDVMGHNYDSAARMGKLSTIVRSYSWPGAQPPEVLTAVDDLLAGSGGLDILATCVVATLHLDPAGGGRLRYASAGHPPSLLRAPDGTVTVLDAANGAMLGVARMVDGGLVRPPAAEFSLPSGSTIICFTDGLVDAFSDDLDIDGGVAALAEATASLPATASPHAIVSRLTEGTEQAKDDVAVVAIRLS